MSQTTAPFQVLYCGDTTLDTAASYLAGVLCWAGLKFRYVPSDRPLDSELAAGAWNAIILSDYPAARVPHETQQRIVDRIHGGAGLLMLGGWESYHGLGGDWDGTPIGELLPVNLASQDDRWNCDRALVVQARRSHPVIDDLPWNDRPPLIGGLNRLTMKPGDELLLAAEEYAVSWQNAELRAIHTASHPLLVTGKRGAGRVAALATDVAPHWVGPLVDWGPQRVTAQAPGAPSIEVGNLYAEFFAGLVRWVAGSKSRN
jgi:hypothetical protein